jgi:electron transfer flavoprotein alpha subunit
VLAPQVAALAANYSHVLGPSTTFGKDLMPRVAALLGEAQVSDVMKVLGSHSFKRPIYAGNAIITVEAPQDRRPGRDRAHRLVRRAAGGGARQHRSKPPPSSGDCRRTRASSNCSQPAPSDRPDLQTASAWSPVAERSVRPKTSA